MRELPENWHRAEDLESHRGEMGLEIYRYDGDQAFLVKVRDDYGAYAITAEFATMATEVELLSLSESDHSQALRQAKKMMEMIEAVLELFESYQVAEGMR